MNLWMWTTISTLAEGPYRTNNISFLQQRNWVYLECTQNCTHSVGRPYKFGEASPIKLCCNMLGDTVFCVLCGCIAEHVEPSTYSIRSGHFKASIVSTTTPNSNTNQTDLQHFAQFQIWITDRRSFGQSSRFPNLSTPLLCAKIVRLTLITVESN